MTLPTDVLDLWSHLPVVEVAPMLLGCLLRTRVDGDITELRITEVEAYDGENDPASHAYRGRTPRNGSMFGPAGTLYVYRSYGIHWCANIAVGAVGDPAAVLVRGGVPTVGAAVMARRRGRDDHLADGPGKLTQALGITGDHDGSDVCGGPVRLSRGEQPVAIETTPRIGITRATDRLWRFVATDSPRS